MVIDLKKPLEFEQIKQLCKQFMPFYIPSRGGAHYEVRTDGQMVFLLGIIKPGNRSTVHRSFPLFSNSEYQVEQIFMFRFELSVEEEKQSEAGRLWEVVKKYVDSHY